VVSELKSLQSHRDEMAALVGVVDQLFASLERKATIDASILAMGYQINSEYDTLRIQSQTVRTEQDRFELLGRQLRRVSPIQEKIDAQRAESTSILANIALVENQVREFLVNCARQIPQVAVLVERFGEVYGSRRVPDVHLFKLRQFLTEAVTALDSPPKGAPGDAQGAAQAGVFKGANAVYRTPSRQPKLPRSGLQASPV
jgi:hypothetical protein